MQIATQLSHSITRVRSANPAAQAEGRSTCLRAHAAFQSDTGFAKAVGRQPKYEGVNGWEGCAAQTVYIHPGH